MLAVRGQTSESRNPRIVSARSTSVCLRRCIVRQSTTWVVPVTEAGERYGYQWWGIQLYRHDNVFDLSDQVLEAAAAVGRGGQWVLVYPELDLVAVFTGGNDNRLSDQPLDILRRYIFPAILG